MEGALQPPTLNRQLAGDPSPATVTPSRFRNAAWIAAVWSMNCLRVAGAAFGYQGRGDLDRPARPPQHVHGAP
jgi:hypothetical protein